MTSEADYEQQLKRDLIKKQQDSQNELSQESFDGRQMYGGASRRLVKTLDSHDIDVDDSVYYHTLQRIGRVASSESKAEAIKQGILLGGELRAKIRQGEFNAFFIALILAMAKDLLDIPSDIVFPLKVISFFLAVALLVVVMFQGVWFKRWIIKKMWKRLVVMLFIDWIPIVGMFPWYTISVLLVKSKADNEIRKHQVAVDDLERELKYIGR